MTEPSRPGYQVEMEWRGETVVTLADVWPTDPVAAIVGLNPSPLAAQTGHYYQGQVGQRQLKRVGLAAAWPLTTGRDQFEAHALASGFGMTDIVKRPTVGEKDLTRDELAYGRERLREVLEGKGVGLVICVYRQPVLALLGTAEPPGLQSGRTASGARVFRMPGPYDKPDAAAVVVDELRAVLDNFRR